MDTACEEDRKIITENKSSFNQVKQPAMNRFDLIPKVKQLLSKKTH